MGWFARALMGLVVMPCSGGLIRAQAAALADPFEVTSGAVALGFGLDRPERARPLAEALDRELHRLATTLGEATSPPVRLIVHAEETRARAQALALCGRELQGLGVIAAEPSVAVLLPPPAWRGELELQRLLLHVAAQLFVAQLLPSARQDELGYGWLAAGLAHRASRCCASAR